jgi:glutamate-5-semialdehyde dehydrogenase
MLLDEGVQLLCDPSAYFELKQLSDHPRYSSVLRATAQDFKTEHLGYVISILCVNNVSDAIKFINSHSSHHTDAIVTTNEAHAKQFVRGVDSAGVFVNASTRFADGFRYGFGTEVGISTGKIHARGPVGLEGLVTYKYVLKSTAENGHIVGEFGNAEDKKKFKHTPMPKMPRLY